jgi:hypothetical protein
MPTTDKDFKLSHE